MALSEKEQKEKQKSLDQIEYKIIGENTATGKDVDGKELKFALHEDNYNFKKGETIWLTPRRAKQINTGRDPKTGEETELKIVEPIKAK